MSSVKQYNFFTSIEPWKNFQIKLDATTQNIRSADSNLFNIDYYRQGVLRNDLNDTNNNISTTNNHSNHSNHQKNKFNNDALKFQILEELPNQIKDYLNNFEIIEIRIIKSTLLKGKNLLIIHMIHIIV